MSLHQVGSRCYHCAAGVFVHRSEWHYVPCMPCHGEGYGCEACKRTGVIATRIQESPDTLLP